MTEHLHRRRPDLLHEVQRPPTVERLTVLAVSFQRGEGCCADDLARTCVAYYRDDGSLIYVVDPLVFASDGAASRGCEETE